MTFLSLRRRCLSYKMSHAAGSEDRRLHLQAKSAHESNSPSLANNSCSPPIFCVFIGSTSSRVVTSESTVSSWLHLINEIFHISNEHTFLPLRSSKACSSLAKSENLLAPSASAIRILLPLELSTPYIKATKR